MLSDVECFNCLVSQNISLDLVFYNCDRKVPNDKGKFFNALLTTMSRYLQHELLIAKVVAS